MDRGPYYTFQSCREVVSRSESSGAGNGQWRVVSRADVCGRDSLWLVVMALAGGCPVSAGASHLTNGPARCVGGNGLGC